MLWDYLVDRVQNETQQVEFKTKSEIDPSEIVDIQFARKTFSVYKQLIRIRNTVDQIIISEKNLETKLSNKKHQDVWGINNLRISILDQQDILEGLIKKFVERDKDKKA